MKTNFQTAMLFLLCVLFMSTQLRAQNYYHEIFGADCHDEGYSIFHTYDKNLIMAGYTCSYNGTDDVFFIKVDDNGTFVTEKSINILQNERAYSIIENTNDTGLYVYTMTGDTWDDTLNAGKKDAFLMVTNTIGVPYWVERFTTDKYDDHGRCVIRGSDRSYVICGFTNPCDSDTLGYCNDVLLIKTDSYGNLQWIDYVDINYGDDYGYKLVEFNNNYYVTGYTKKFNTNDNDVFLMQVGLNGNVNWVKTYGDTLDDFAYSLKAMSDSNIVIVGHTYNYSAGVGLPDVLAIKTDVNGIPVWKAHYNTNPNRQENYGRDIVESQLGNGTSDYYITGYSDVLGNNNTYDFHLINTTSNGVMNWQSVYGNGLDNRAYGLTLMPDSGVAMVGYTDSIISQSRLLHDVYLVKVTAQGVGCENYPDTNYHYIDSLYDEPPFTVVNDSAARFEHFMHLKPADYYPFCVDSDTTHHHRLINYFDMKEGFQIVSIYPNPVAGKDILHVLIESGEEKVTTTEIFDGQGKIVFKKNFSLMSGKNEEQFDLSYLSTGIYFLRVGNSYSGMISKME